MLFDGFMISNNDEVAIMKVVAKPSVEVIADIYPNYGGGATRPLPRNGGVKKLYEDPTVGPCPKVWARG